MDHVKRLPDVSILKKVLEGPDREAWIRVYSDVEAIVGSAEAIEYLKSQVPVWSENSIDDEQTQS